MLNKEKRERIISLIKREVVPAIGCTEPVAVALCVAKATELLRSVPALIGMIGLPIAMALGALTGKSEAGLEVLCNVTPEAVEKGKAYINEGRISIALDPDAPSKLHIDVTAYNDEGEKARSVISCEHTHFVLLQKGDQVLHSEEINGDAAEASDDIALDMAMIYEFATETPLEDISFILEAKRLQVWVALL